MNLKTALQRSNFRPYIQKVIDLYKTIKLYRYYGFHKGETKPDKCQIIVMIDGRIGHGGLSDRFWGILSIYKYCKENNKEFRLYFRSPYNIKQFLLPNEYDWDIDDKELCYDIRFAKPKHISLISLNPQVTYQSVVTSLKCSKMQQHIYTNTRTFHGQEFHQLFFEIFKLTPELQQEIDYHKKAIGSDYVSVTFRFQQLLGDFKEGNFPILASEEEKKKLINKCLSIVKSIADKHSCRVLVTSDSSLFLDYAKNIPEVYVIPGKIVHVDFCGNDESHNVHLKSYIDLFMLANAGKIYLGNPNPLYYSRFPWTASFIMNKPYAEISEPLK